MAGDSSTAAGIRLGLMFPVVFGVLALVGLLDGVVGVVPARLIGLALAFVAARLLVHGTARSIADYGWTKPTVGSALGGLGLGFGFVTAVTLVMIVAGWFEPRFDGVDRAVLTAVIVGVLVALFEEALFRSVWFAGMEPVFGTHLTVWVSAVLFGAAHLANPGATPFSALAITLSAGPLLGYAFAATRNLWLVSGIHAGWNIALGAVFGFAVSGNETETSLIGGEVSGPVLGTGGEFGPEATLQTILIVGLVAVFFLRRTTASKPIWSQSSTDGAVSTPK
jgi:uncharacterized protein